MNKDELRLLNSRNPEEYIENSLKCRLPSGRKASITRQWLDKKKKYTIDDIKYARNRHPYWKEKKMLGSLERNQQRQQEHNYTYKGEIEWDEKTIKKFLDLNKKDGGGKYITRDYQLAEKFSTTIPAIQHYRRKFNIVMKILDRMNQNPTEKRILEHIGISEKILRDTLRDMKKKR